MTDLVAELERVKWNNVPESFVVFDVETTGLDHKKDRVLEIGAVLFEKSSYIETGQVTTFQCFVKQSAPIPPEATAINGITDEMVKDGQEEYEALESFFEFVGNNDLFAYNAEFDKSFMNAMAKRSRYASEPVVDEAFDIYKFIKEEIVIRPNYKLTNVARHLKIETSDAHRAVGDSLIALKSYIHVIQLLNYTECKRDLEHKEWCKKNLSTYKEKSTEIGQAEVQVDPLPSGKDEASMIKWIVIISSSIAIASIILVKI